MSGISLRRAFLLAAALLLVGIQFIPTGLDRTPPDPALSLVARLEPSFEIIRILGRSCADCHGTPRAWPWYASVAPVSWLVARDVREAKEHLDLSRWAQYDPSARAKLLGEMCEEAERGEMPPGLYVRVHRDARLSADEARLFCAWTQREQAAAAPAGGAGGREGE